jgi:hypothetical protein
MKSLLSTANRARIQRLRHGTDFFAPSKPAHYPVWQISCWFLCPKIKNKTMLTGNCRLKGGTGSGRWNKLLTECMIDKHFWNTFTHAWKRRTKFLCDMDQSMYIKEPLIWETMQFRANTGSTLAALPGFKPSNNHIKMNKNLQVRIT